MLDPAATCRTGAGSPQTKVGTCLLWVPPAPSWQLALLPRTKRDFESGWKIEVPTRKKNYGSEALGRGSGLALAWT